MTLILAMILSGCSIAESPREKIEHKVSNQVKSLSKREIFDLLDKEAKARGLRWKVSCLASYEDEQESFMADAWHQGDAYADTMQWRLGDHWLKMAPSEDESALGLYYAIQELPTHPAQTPEKVKQREVRKRKMCPPAITDKNYARTVRP